MTWGNKICQGCPELDDFMGMCKRYLAPVIMVDYCNEQQPKDPEREDCGTPPYIPRAAIIGHTPDGRPICDMTLMRKAIREALGTTAPQGVDLTYMSIRITKEIADASECWKPRPVLVRVERGG